MRATRFAAVYWCSPAGQPCLLDSPRHMTSDTTQGMGRAFCVPSNDSHVLSPRERPSVVLSGFV